MIAECSLFEFPFGIWRVGLRIGVREHQLPSSVCTDDFTLHTAPYVLLRHSQGFQHTQQPRDSLGFFCFFPPKEPAASHGEGRGGGSCGRDVFGKQNCSMRRAARLRSTTEARIDSTCAVRSGTIMGPLASGSFQSFRFS